MRLSSRFTVLGSLALLTACSGASELDNAKSARQSDSLSLPYTQDFESGAGEWSSVNGDVILASDPTSPSGSAVQQLDRATFGGDTFSPYLPVVGGQTYCISAKVKWVSGAAPFVGIERSSGNEWLGVSWLFGTAYTDAHGSTQAISSTEPGWQTLSRSVVMPASTTLIRLTDELYVGSVKEGPNLSYLDGISIMSGTCLAYAQDWESGAGGWVDKNGQGPTLVNDDTSPAGATVQQLDRATFGGDYFSPYLPVVGGQAYCISANLRWISGAAPFVGIEQSSANEWLGTSWLFGSAYTDAHGSTKEISSTEPGWQNLSRTVILQKGVTRIRFTNELYMDAFNNGPPISFIDGLSIVEGECALSSEWQIGALAAGYGQTCVLTSSGGARCWGENYYGQLGDGTTIERYTPPSSDVLTNVKAIAAGELHTCAITNSGGVRCWGANDEGQLGDGTTLDRSNPTSTDVLTGVKAIAAGWLHTCALMESGGVRCWGRNDFGTLGDGTTISRSTPTSDVLTGVKAIGAGGWHTCALMESGGVRCWGDNSNGALGDGTRYNRYTPPTTDVLTGVKDIAVGAAHTCALMESGSVRCWGERTGGTLGDGVSAGSSVVPTSEVLSGVKAISAGVAHTCALMDTGGVRCWGYNLHGQLGDGTTNNRATPPKSDIFTGVRSVVAGFDFTCATLELGGVRCWGFNRFGQLGDGTTTDRPSPVQVVEP